MIGIVKSYIIRNNLITFDFKLIVILKLSHKSTTFMTSFMMTTMSQLKIFTPKIIMGAYRYATKPSIYRHYPYEHCKVSLFRTGSNIWLPCKFK